MATITSVDDGDETLPYKVGTRCIVLASGEENNYEFIAFVEINMVTSKRSEMDFNWLMTSSVVTLICRARQIRLIPTHTATGSRVLPAVIPSSLTITCGKDTYAADYLIALSSLGSSRGDFDAVISLH